MSYKAIVSKIDKIEPIEGANNIQIAFILGNQVIVGKNEDVGYIGIFFGEEFQLSEDFCRENNLFRDKENNRNKNKSGFFDLNRKVRTQKFLGVKSEGYFTSLDSLSYTGYDIGKLKLGDQFDELNGYKICQKYLNPRAQEFLSKNKIKKPKSISAPLFLPHVETDQFRYYVDTIPKNSIISISAKAHGTSVRYSYSKTYRESKQNWFQKLFKLKPKTKECFEYLVGTRRVVLFEDERNKEGFHGSEQFRFNYLEKLKPYLIENMTIYGELVGWANGNTIMAKHDVTKLKNKEYLKKYGKEMIYKYGCEEGKNKLFIYRISQTLSDGSQLDYTPAQIEEWCNRRGFEYIKQIYPSFIYNGNTEKLRELVENLTENPQKLTEDYYDPYCISEGVVIRVDTNTTVPLFYKNKSFVFKIMESIIKEQEIDLEDIS